MRDSTGLQAWLLVGLVAWGLGLAAGTGQGAEEAWRFLNGLRDRQPPYYDMALAYLDRIAKSPQCPEDLKEQIDYERGVTLVASSRLAGTAREAQLDQARDAFQKFLQEHPDHALAGDANTQLANVLVERGRMKAELAERSSKSAEEKKQLMAESRAHYEEAQKVFVAAERKLYERAKIIEEEARKDPRKESDRDAARSELVRARLRLAGVVHEIGKTYEPGSKEYKDLLTEAAKKYNELYEKYKEYGASLYARRDEGRVYKDLGESDKAIAIFKELLTLVGDDAAVRKFRDESLGLLLETYLAPNVKKYADALAQVQTWQEAAPDAEQSSPEGLRIRFLAGQAGLSLAESLPADDAGRKQSLRAARQHFEHVARFRGQYQREARNMLTHELLGGAAKQGEPTTFGDALERGDFAWTTVVLNQGKIKEAKTAEEKTAATAEMDQARRDALRYYQAALGLKDEQTLLDDLNLARFRLAYLYFISQDYYRAAVMGEFLASRYPQDRHSSQAAEIAIKAYRVLYATSPKPKAERTFEMRRMNELAALITTRWPSQPEAAEAWLMLLDTAVDNRNLDQARQYLEKIEPDSPRRADAELRIGQALWATYVEESRKPEGERPPQEQLDALITQAKQTLEQGIERMRKQVDEGGSVEYALVYSVLALAQIYIGAGQSAEAVKWLDDPKVGPTALVAAKHPATEKENFRIETYRAALRAYVGAEQLDKAEQTMNDLEAAVASGGDAAAARRLTETYIVLGSELQETLKRLRQENKNAEAETVAKGFELFLDRISRRDTGNTFGSLNWVAETYFNLGASLDPGGAELPPKAKEYYTGAAKTYLAILKKIKEDPNFAPADGETNVQVRLAVCLRALDKHAEALKILLSILRQRERRVDVQIEAARTYQDWAALKGKSDYYNVAIKGGNEEGGRYLVWGWGGIAKRVAPFEQYRSTFHEARYNLAECRLNYAQTLSGPERESTLKMAELDITRTYQLYPDMGGEQWKAKYDALLKTIQKLLGKRPDGLAGGAKTSPASTTPTNRSGPAK